jgi:predicted naringenin-chalcone synthase
VSARAPAEGARAARLERFASSVVADSEDAMAWSIGDHGFRLTLSTYVSKIIATHLRPLLLEGIASFGLAEQDVDVWAVHPGGKSILDRIEAELDLAPGHLAVSRSVLRAHGNMSSATILFVLKALLASESVGSVCALAFGPGLTVEMAHLTLGTGDV